MSSSSVVVLGREPSLSPKGSSENSPFLGDAISLDNDISDDFPISALPRIPQKNHQKLKCEYLRGIGVVEGSCVITLTTCHGLAWACNFEPYQLWLPIMIFTRVVSVVAVVCHALIMFGDPGTVFRSRETCYPVPPVVAERLRAGDKLDDLDNVRGEEWSSYCVRCCVWRRSSGKLESACLPADCDMRVCEAGPLQNVRPLCLSSPNQKGLCGGKA